MNLTEFIVNPVTNRPIRKNGSKYYELLKQGVDMGDKSLDKFQNDNIVCSIEDKTEEELDEIKKNFNEQNEDYCCVRGRGVLKKYLVKKRKKMTYENFGNELAKTSSKKIINYLRDENNLDNLEIEIARMIDKQAQILSKKYQHCSKYYLLKDNFKEVKTDD